MKSSQQNLLVCKVDVNETYAGGQDDTVISLNEGKEKIVVMTIEKLGRGVSRMYDKVINTVNRKNLSMFMKDHVSKEVEVRTDKRSEYK